MKTTLGEVKRVIREALVEGNGGVETCPYCDHEFGTDAGSYHPPGRVQCPECGGDFDAEHDEEHNADMGMGGDYESYVDLKVDHPEAAEQWLDTVAGGSESDSWWEDENGGLWGMSGRQTYEWVPDRGWEPRRS